MYSGLQLARDVNGSGRTKRERPFQGTSPARVRQAQLSRLATPRDQRPSLAKPEPR